MAIPQINQITSVLRDMPDAQLQQYAAMHKNDPYVLSLAVAESNARKQLRASQQAKMAGQKPPTVVEQDLMAMAPQPQLPEQQGIGALPTPNVAHMADGGIAGYDDTPEQLVYNNEPVMRMAGGGHVPRYQGNTTDGSVVGGGVLGDMPGYVQGSPFMPQPGDGSTETTLEKIQRYLQGRRAERAQYQAEKTGKPVKQEQGQDFSAFEKATDAYMADRDARKKANEEAKKGIDKSDKGGAGTKDLGIAALGSGNFEKTLEKYKPSDVAETSTEYAARRKAEIGDDPTVKQMARIEKQEAGVAGEKEDALRNAMMTAGLGILSGTSQYWSENIGKGGIMGVSQYNDAMKDLKKAALERDKARDAIENAAYAYKRGDFDAYEKLTEKSKDRQADYNKYAMSALGTIEGAKIHAGATLGAAKIGRENLTDYRNQAMVENIRKNIESELKVDPAFKFDAGAREAEIERRLQIELQRYPNLAQYGRNPTTSGASGATNTGKWGPMSIS